MEIIVNNIKSQILTDNEELLKTLQELYTFSVPGAYFSSSYKQNRWDGKKNFISKKGYFRTGLLPRILDDLKRIECIPKITRDPCYEPLNWKIPIDTIGPFELRTYQKEYTNKAVDMERCIVKAPTGAGKTLIMAGILKHVEVYGKGIILFHQKHGLNQTYDFLKKCGIERLGKAHGEEFILGDIMLCTYQSIDKILDTHLDAKFLLVDEAHEFSAGKITVACIQAFDDAKIRIGFTATPPKDPIKLLTLEGALGPVLEVKTTEELIKEGHLAKPKIQMVTKKYPELKDVADNMSYKDIYQTCIVNNVDRNETIKRIIDIIKRKNTRARIMVLVSELEHARILQDLISGSFKLWGSDDLITRYETIKQFITAEDNTVLIGTKILQTGIDIKEITHFIMARGLKSWEATIQAIGRSLRKHNPEVYIYDFIDDIKYLREHSMSRLRAYKAQHHEVRIL